MTVTELVDSDIEFTLTISSPIDKRSFFDNPLIESNFNTVSPVANPI